MRKTAITGLCLSKLAMISMIIGHLGSQELNVIFHPISTYAALGPNDNWITLAMLLSALAICCFRVRRSMMPGSWRL